MQTQNKNKNILFITSRADVGGGPKHLHDLINYIKNNKNNNSDLRIHIAAPLEHPFGPVYKSSSDLFIDIPKRKFSFKTLVKLLFVIKKHNIHIIHSHGRGAGIYSRLIKLLSAVVFLRVKVIHTFHGIHQGSNLSGKIKIFIERVLKYLTTIFICVSNDEKTKAVEYKVGDKTKIKVINNGVDLNLSANKDRQANRQENKQEKREKYLVGTLARLDYSKGVDLLLNAVKKYFTLYPDSNVKFLIAGGRAEEVKLKNLSKDLGLIDSKRVEFLGQINKVNEFLNNLDAYVSFSRGEGLPLAVLEAMSSGVPCLLSNVSGHRELMSDECGILFDLDEKEFKDFSTSIASLKNNPQLGPKLSKNAQIKIKAKYTLEAFANQTLDVYNSLT